MPTSASDQSVGNVVTPVPVPRDDAVVNRVPPVDGETRRVVPPPPPPRSTLPPVGTGPPVGTASIGGTGESGRVRHDAGSAVPATVAGERNSAPQGGNRRNGIAAATGVRWAGEFVEPEQEEETESGEANWRWSISMKDAPPWLISTVVHLIFLILLALFTFPTGAGIGILTLELSDGNDAETEPFAEFEVGEVEEPTVEDPLLTETIEPIVAVDVFEPFVPEALDLTPVAASIGEAVSVEPPRLVSGRTGALKKVLLAAYGGTDKTEEAVAAGLRWIVRQQAKDGSWSLVGPYEDGGFAESKIAATSMALIALAGAGNTHFEGEYKENVSEGLKWLTRQNKRGEFSHGRQGHHRTYSQAQAMIALCELYSMTNDSWLRPYCQQALDYSKDTQSTEGGWRYAPQSDSDTSVTGWYLMGLQSALNTDLEVSGGSLQKINYYLDSIQLYDGAAYPYQKGRGESASMTAEGLLCRQYLGWSRDNKEMQIGIAAILRDHNFDLSQHNVYFWYYATQLLHHYGGSSWQIWNDRMRDDLPRSQIKTGREKGSWAPQEDVYGSNWGRFYTTCLSVYCLEVYYRHLPLYGIDEGG